MPNDKWNIIVVTFYNKWSFSGTNFLHRLNVLNSKSNTVRALIGNTETSLKNCENSGITFAIYIWHSELSWFVSDSRWIRIVMKRSCILIRRCILIMGYISVLMVRSICRHIFRNVTKSIHFIWMHKLRARFSSHRFIWLYNQSVLIWIVLFRCNHCFSGIYHDAICVKKKKTSKLVSFGYSGVCFILSFTDKGF